MGLLLIAKTDIRACASRAGRTRMHMDMLGIHMPADRGVGTSYHTHVPWLRREGEVVLFSWTTRVD